MIIGHWFVHNWKVDEAWSSWMAVRSPICSTTSLLPPNEKKKWSWANTKTQLQIQIQHGAVEWQLDLPSVLQHHQTFAISLWWDFSTESKEYNVAPSCKIPLVFSETAAGSSGCDWRSRRTKKTKTIKQIKRKKEQQKETKNDRAKKQKQQKDKFPSWHTRMATVDKMDNVCFSWQIWISCFLWHVTIV